MTSAKPKFVLIAGILLSVALLAAACNQTVVQNDKSSSIAPPTQTTTPSNPSLAASDAAVCKNITYGYELKVPQGWSVLTRGEGEARSASCNEGLETYYFAQDFNRNEFHNQINLQVMNATNQSKAFWTGFNSLTSYLKVKALTSQVASYGTVDGERIAYLLPVNDTVTDGQYIDAYVYHNNNLYVFTFYDVGTSTRNEFVSSFKFIN